MSEKSEEEKPRYIIECDDEIITAQTVERIKKAWFNAYGDTNVLVVPRGFTVKRIDGDSVGGSIEIVKVPPLSWFERLKAGLADWFRWQQ